MPTTQQLRTRLVDKLKDLFQLNQPDLDFGFYRIMHAKAEQVTRFLEDDLLAIIGDAFGEVDDTRKAQLKAEYEKEVETAREYGATEPESVPKVAESRARYETAQNTATAEGEIYDHLYRFFERYYDNGDFISRRYYTRETPGKAAPFAVPYNGEEVKLHWANADQYYIKTAEHFRNFTVDLRQADEIRKLAKADELGLEIGDETPRLVHFRIVDATEGEHGNVKASEATKRYFIIHKDEPVSLNESGELVVHFEYRPDPEKSGQENTWRDKRNAEAVELVLAALDSLSGAEEYKRLMAVPAPTEKDKKRPLLAKYINQYTARNTMDYFIHKDLGAFLRRELDFYIKNEVMRLDDIENAEAPAVETYLSKLKVLRTIARKLIDFMAQLEDFQKRLWLKKKFVVETNYCITLDRIPEEFYKEIAANDAQREEWVRLFGVVDADSRSVGFLKSHPNLMIDTTYFTADASARFLSDYEMGISLLDGLVVESENFQALRFLQSRFGGIVKCSYIDPPYNTGGDGFSYKDSYRHSSWLTMMCDRLSWTRRLLQQKGVIYASIDAGERTLLEEALCRSFGVQNRVEELVWVQNATKSQSPTFSTNHEYVEVFSKDYLSVKNDITMFREPKPGYAEVQELVDRLNPEFPSIHEIETALRDLYREHRETVRQMAQADGELDVADLDEWKGLYNYSHAEYRDIDGLLVDEEDAGACNASIWVWREDNPAMPPGKQAASTAKSEHPNYRFYEPKHPLTGERCTHPKTGWRWPFQPIEGRSTSFSELAASNRIVWGDDARKIPQRKLFLREVDTNVSKSVINDYTDGEKQLTNLFGRSRSFSNPKPSTLIRRFIQQVTSHNDVVIDFFAGSGTTGQAVIDANKHDGGGRSFVLVDMDDCIDTILIPRIKKAVYASDWKDGQPVDPSTGISHCFKYIRLESYEDCLNNLLLPEDATRDHTLDNNAELREDYMLHYMLDVETRGSQSLLNIDAFTDPTAYKLKVKKPGSDQYATRQVDLIETFNYLIGLRVTHIAAPQSFAATFKRETDPELPEDTQTRLVVDGRLTQAEDGPWWFRKVEGWIPANPNNPNNGEQQKVLIVWRKLTGKIEEDNLMLDEWFQRNRISTRDFEFDLIYVNGSNNLPNLKQEGDDWKVRLIEEDFMRLMWDVEDV